MAILHSTKYLNYECKQDRSNASVAEAKTNFIPVVFRTAFTCFASFLLQDASHEVNLYNRSFLHKPYLYANQTEDSTQFVHL